LRQFAQLERALDDELDSEPGADSTNLLVAIKRGDVGLDRGEPAPVRAGRNGPPRITIRPPLTRHADRSKDYLGEGFAYLARAALARFRSWIVIPWPASGFDARTAIDADFAIDCVLDWRGPKGKLFVTLFDCRDASEVWSGIHEIAETDLQRLSANVAGAVAASLSSQVNYVTLRRYARNALASPAAHDLWLRAHQLSQFWKAGADAEAEVLLAQAIELDPGLACAHASLAEILNTRSMVRHISMGWSWLIEGSAERANSHFRLSVDLNPHDSETLIAAACGLAFLGHLDEAIAWADLALQLNPIHPEYFYAYLAGIQFLNGDYPAAIQTVGKVPDFFPDLVIWSAAAWAHLDRPSEAARAYAAFRNVAISLWEGSSPPDDDALEAWLRATIPIIWPEGRHSFERGIRLARQMEREPTQ
jgi:tetratricopeptide (TPR) repeat protein